jgi:hypothetical protein
MRTTIDIWDSLLIQAKRLAAEERSSLRALVEDGLRLVISSRRKKPASSRRRSKLPVCDAGRLLPGINLNDTSTLLEIMCMTNVLAGPTMTQALLPRARVISSA